MKKSSIILLLIVCAVVALGLILTHIAQPTKNAQVVNAQPASDIGVESNSNAIIQAKELAVTNSPPTNSPTVSLPDTNLNALISTNKPEEVFKTVLLPTGLYVCTDTGRQMFYLKGKNGVSGFPPVNILEYLHIKPDPTNVNDKITSITTDGSNMVIYVEGQPHVLKLNGKGNN